VVGDGMALSLWSLVVPFFLFVFSLFLSLSHLWNLPLRVFSLSLFLFYVCDLHFEYTQNRQLHRLIPYYFLLSPIGWYLIMIRYGIRVMNIMKLL